ncbi:MAG: hypothetical protein ACTH1D_10180 [Mycobacteriaceae bacterium]|uniref:hypothetical protein n=1 Tax=Corynebacterium sp. TaxID=1720 RepID=UPI003F97129C
MLVVIFHVLDGRVSAGVDVFLLIGELFFYCSQFRNSASNTGLRLWQSGLGLQPDLHIGGGTQDCVE